MKIITVNVINPIAFTYSSQMYFKNEKACSLNIFIPNSSSYNLKLNLPNIFSGLVKEIKWAFHDVFFSLGLLESRVFVLEVLLLSLLHVSGSSNKIIISGFGIAMSNEPCHCQCILLC